MYEEFKRFGRGIDSHLRVDGDLAGASLVVRPNMRSRFVYGLSVICLVCIAPLIALQSAFWMIALTFMVLLALGTLWGLENEVRVMQHSLMIGRRIVYGKVGISLFERSRVIPFEELKGVDIATVLKVWHGLRMTLSDGETLTVGFGTENDVRVAAAWLTRHLTSHRLGEVQPIEVPKALRELQAHAPRFQKEAR